MMRSLRAADLVVAIGAELEVGWLPVAIASAANPRILPGTEGYFEAAAQVPLIDVGGAADRAMGDIHPLVNPHVDMDPVRMATVARALAERLALIDPAGASQYHGRAAGFAAKVDERMPGWRGQIAGAPGVVLYHRDAIYLLDRFAAAAAPAVIGGTVGALLGGVAKGLMRARGNVAYGFMILIGWAAMLLVAANTAIGDALGHAMIDGQLYFAGALDLGAALLLAGVCLALLHWLSGRLLRARFFPRFERANALPAWRWHLVMDLLAAAGMAVGTATVGLMGAFALVFVPAWIAFRFAPSWRWTLIVSAMIGVGGYLIAFVLALSLDQPFGPVLVGALVALAAVATIPRGLLGVGSGRLIKMSRQKGVVPRRG